MFKNLDPQDISKKSFQTFKNFTFTNNDSGSGVFAIKARSGSIFNYISSSDDIVSITTGSITTNYFSLPNWHMLNQTFYSTHGQDYVNPNKSKRELHTSASIISVPREAFGEKIKPGSVILSDTSLSATRDIRDDGEGNLYDNAFSASFAAFKSGSSDGTIAPFTVTGSSTRGSGSQIGNVFYEHGLLVFTNTGSKYIDIGTKTGTDGYSLKYKSQITIREHSYTCVIGENEMNSTNNISATYQRSGSLTVSGSESWKFFPPGHATAQSGSYKYSYNASNKYENFVTHSEFRPYITKVGLYNDFNELVAVGQLSHPVKNDKELALAIQVRFDA